MNSGNGEDPYREIMDCFLQKFLGYFQIPEMKKIAERVFREYADNEGRMGVDDIRRLKEIVEESYVMREEIDEMIKMGIEEVRALTQEKLAFARSEKNTRRLPLPRKGVSKLGCDSSATGGQDAAPARKEGEAGNEVQEEIDELEENRYALRGYRLPTAIICVSGPASVERKRSIITDLKEWGFDGDEKKQA